MARRRIFTKQIGEKIIELIDSNIELNFLKTVMIGNLDLLPAKEDFPTIMPALLIDPVNVYNSNADSSKSITASVYEFEIRYLKYFEPEQLYTVLSEALTESELIADTLMEDDDLGNLLNATGQVLKTDLSDVTYKSEEAQVFRDPDVDIPVLLVTMNYKVYFRSLYVKGAVK